VRCCWFLFRVAPFLLECLFQSPLQSFGFGVIYNRVVKADLTVGFVRLLSQLLFWQPNFAQGFVCFVHFILEQSHIFKFLQSVVDFHYWDFPVVKLFDCFHIIIFLIDALQRHQILFHLQNRTIRFQTNHKPRNLL